MTRQIRKLTATVSAAALLGAGAVGAAQAATGTTDRPGQGRGGHHALSTTQLQAIASKLGVTTDQLKAAVEANQPSKPTGDRGDGMATALATALGVDAAKVETILDANRPARPAKGTKPAAGTRPARGAKPDNSKLVAALATGLSLDEATVKAAFDTLEADRKAAHETAEDARYAAIATALGVDAAAVEAAFEAARPAKPTR